MKNRHIRIAIACVLLIFLFLIWKENPISKANVNISFVGRVVDENGSPVEGALVNYRLEVASIRSVLFQPSVYDNGNSTSGVDGVFVIKGKKGITLSVGPLCKEGYRDTLIDQRAFGYFGTPDVHDKVNRVDFLMVKNEIQRSTEVYDHRLKFAWNKGEIRVSLKKGLGDLVLIPTREMQPDQREGFDWKLIVFMENADILSNSSMIAPASGYENKIEYGYGKNDPEWGGAVQERYAFKTKDGRYGSISLNVYVERKDFEVSGSLRVRLNESGNRNLD